MSGGEKKVSIDLAQTRVRLDALEKKVQIQMSSIPPTSPSSPGASRRHLSLLTSKGLPLGATPPPRQRKVSAPAGAGPHHRRTFSGGSVTHLGLSSCEASPDGLSGGPARFSSHTSLISSASFGSTSSLDQQIDEHKRSTRYVTIEGRRYLASADDLEKLGQIGHGTTGQVMRVRHKPSGKIMACKVMQRNANEEEQKRVLMDLFVMINHTCPHIVESYGSIISKDDVYICMELMSTCLEKLMKRYRKPIPEPIVGRVAVAIVLALDYLKEKQDIIHRDIKPSNILLDAETGCFKICDFGISGRLVDSKARTRGAGCAAYMAPERVMPATSAQYDIRADVWSTGITLVELATGEFPYRGCTSEFEVLTQIMDAEAPKLPADGSYSLDFHSFITQCLTKNRDKRPKFRDLKYHPFIKRYKDTPPTEVCEWYQRLLASASDAER